MKKAFLAALGMATMIISSGHPAMAAGADPLGKSAIWFDQDKTGTRAHVATRDLDLRTAGGRSLLKSRISRAADELCWREEGPSAISPVRRACYRSAMRSAHDQVEQAFAAAAASNAVASRDAVTIRFAP